MQYNVWDGENQGIPTFGAQTRPSIEIPIAGKLQQSFSWLNFVEREIVVLYSRLTYLDVIT